MKPSIVVALTATAVALASAPRAWADLPPVPGAPIAAIPERFEKRVVATGLANPHNMVLGPDGALWITEQIARRVTRVDPQTGKATIALQVDDAVHTKDAQDGLLGLALHPDLLKHRARDYVYVSLTYATSDGGASVNRTAIRRYTYDATTQRLGSPVDLLIGLPSSHDHQSARLLFGPDQKLYYSIGDQGANQISYLCVANMAQTLPSTAEVKSSNWTHYAGKILRINLDGSIPVDNPMIHGTKSHVYAWGIRNTQGMVFSPLGKLFATDHGPNSDDELNLILPGKNYGWPNVAGRKDDAGYAYANYSAARGGCQGLQDPGQNGLRVPPSVPVQKESEWSDPDFVEPLRTFFTVDSAYRFDQKACAEGGLYYICWPTIAPSSVAYYRSGKAGVPGWDHSLLITSMKRGVLYRVQLDPTESVVVGEAQPIFRTLNRYREVVVSPDGGTIYVATDAEGGNGTSDAGSAASKFENPGAILAFTLAPHA